jgi:hypothetical protein
MEHLYEFISLKDPSVGLMFNHLCLSLNKFVPQYSGCRVKILFYNNQTYKIFLV